jgi:hypothetical protein
VRLLSRVATLAMLASAGAAGRDAPAFERFAVGGMERGLIDAGALTQRLSVPALPTAFRTGDRYALYRIAVARPGPGFEAYVTSVTTGDGAQGPVRLAGIERRLLTIGVPQERRATMQVTGGVARILDAPLTNRTRAYIGAVYTP